MGSAEKFCLRWNDFETNVSSAFRELRDQKDFFDVTLACEDEQIHAHKVILGACSTFFRAVLRRNPHQHPLLYLKGVKYADLESVLNFMYHGEVNVAQDDLNSFLAVAEELKVKGLTQNQNGESGSSSKSTPPVPPSSSSGLESSRRSPPPKVRPPPPPDRDSGGGAGPPLKRARSMAAPLPPPPPVIPPTEDDDIQEVLPIKSEPKEMSGTMSAPSASTSGYDNQALVQQDESSYAEEGYEDYGEYEEEEQYPVDPGQTVGGQADKANTAYEDLWQYVGRTMDLANGGKPFYCKLCNNFTGTRRGLTRNHVESIHFPGLFSYVCSICPKTFQSRNALNVHNSCVHSAKHFM